MHSIYGDLVQRGLNHTESAMSDIDRRQFLRNSTIGATSLATTVPLLAEGPAAKAPASERLQVGCVGVGGRAEFLMKTFAGRKEVDLVTLCDLDTNRLGRAVETVTSITGKKPRTESDFRKLIDDPKLDAIVVGTPDHWHAIPTIFACLAG